MAHLQEVVVKTIITVSLLGLLVGIASAFDFTNVEVNYDPKGKEKNIIIEINNVNANIFHIPQVEKVKAEDVVIFTFGVGVPKKKPETLPGTAVAWLSSNRDVLLDVQASVTVRFPKDTTLDFSKTYHCYRLISGDWVDGGEVRVDAKERSLSFFMKNLGTYALSHK